MQHSFDIDIAKKYGIVEATLLNFLYTCTYECRDSDVHLYDGKYFVRCSEEEFGIYFPFVCCRTLRRVRDTLKKEGLIATDKFNIHPFDNTKWYALTDKALAMLKSKERG